jgi:dimethylaniline monooxygenase (N-oxide forming)
VSRQPRVCVIGAGASGITAGKSLAERGIAFDCLERADRVGGDWVQGGGGSCPSHEALNLDISRERLEFAGCPMPKSYPLFPRRAQLARYLEDYVERFGLERHIRLGAAVQSVRRCADASWELRLDSGEVLSYDMLVVASGHHAKPYWPRPKGEFHGEQMHAHSYCDREILRDRDVLVVGCANGGCDIAVEASYVARSTRISIREDLLAIPLTMFGRPYDQIPGSTYLLGSGVGRGASSAGLPRRLGRSLLTGAHRIVYPTSVYGLPMPKRSLGAVQLTQAQHLLERLMHGRVEVKRDVERLDGEQVHFADGSCARADLIVWCTGYELSFPFLAPELAPVHDDRVELYRNVFSPSAPNLAFVGLIQASAGAAMAVVEAQGRWVAAHVAGECALPSEQAMWGDIEKRRRLSGRRPITTPQDAIEIDSFDYIRRLERELGSRRLRLRSPRRPRARHAVPGL